jgi:hypothetical protein
MQKLKQKDNENIKVRSKGASQWLKSGEKKMEEPN